MDLLDEARVGRLPNTLEIHEIAELWFGDSPGPEHSERFHKRFYEFVDDMDRAYDEGGLPAKREERSQDGNISTIGPRPYYIFVYRDDFFSWLATPVPADSLISRWQAKTKATTPAPTYDRLSQLAEKTYLALHKKLNRWPTYRETYKALCQYDDPKNPVIEEMDHECLQWITETETLAKRLVTFKAFQKRMKVINDTHKQKIP